MPGFLIDTNVWVAATFPSHEFHAVSLAAIEAATSLRPAYFCRSTEQNFLRLATSPRLLAHYGAEGTTNRSALAALNVLQARANVRVCEEPTGTVALWHRLAACDAASPKVWMAAYLAAFAITGGLQYVTLDRDFKSYQAQGLKLVLLGT